MTTQSSNTRSAATVSHRAIGSALRRSRLFPLVFFQLYLLASILVFAFGPVDLEIENAWVLYAYALAGQAAIFLGYTIGIMQGPRGYCGPLSASTLLKTAIVATLAILPVTLQYRNYADVSFIEAIRDPGIAYAARLEAFDGESHTPLLSLTRGLLAPISGLFLPLGLVYWRRLAASWRTLWCLGCVGLIAEFVFSGAAVRLFDMVLAVPWLLWLRLQHQNDTSTIGAVTAGKSRQRIVATTCFRSSRGVRQRVFFVVTTVLLLAVGLKCFSYSRLARYGLPANEYPPFTTGWSAERYGMPLPESVEYPIYIVARYWTHGYLGLADCLQMPFEWSFGCGHSGFLSRCAGKVLGCEPSDIVARTYPARLEAQSGYSIINNWHTIYPWLASDLTFAGALVFMAWMAFLLARAWVDAISGANPFAVGFLMQALMLFYYLPANSGRLSYAEETLMFWSSLGLWLLTRRR